MSPSQQKKVAAYQWAVETLEQARLASSLSVITERYVIKLQMELQARAEKIEANAERLAARRQRLKAVYAQMDDDEPDD